MSATAETAVKIRKGRKYDQVLDGARAVFLAHGFEGASVDDIARAAGVSKATLYSYFADKRVLFMEVASQQCQAQADLALQQLDLSAPPDV
ncbi:MAG: TetR/AcrR family transcriptional regulator, partial [Primorskyibacter sp.]